ncbi:MAG TPA: hypothetical protein VNL71_03815 [Chloroflexota bacterium]|nr:hypothetical protein [Chloroflexota bacterium]
MTESAVGVRSEEISDAEQGKLTVATAAYFEALPRLHQELIGELSACRQVDPVALIGQALADGLERMVDEVRSPASHIPIARPLTPPPAKVARYRVDGLTTRKAG